MKRAVRLYEWPEALFPLRDWLRRKGCDTENFKSERQAFWIAKTLGNQSVAFPKDRRASLFPQLQKLQRTLCPTGASLGRPKREPWVPGTFGPASGVRNINVAEYLAANSSSNQ